MYLQDIQEMEDIQKTSFHVSPISKSQENILARIEQEIEHIFVRNSRSLLCALLLLALAIHLLSSSKHQLNEFVCTSKLETIYHCRSNCCSPNKTPLVALVR